MFLWQLEKYKHFNMAGDENELNKTNFLISLNGQIQSAFFPFFDDIYCKYSFVCGPDWIVISGVEEGISQISKKGRDEEQLFVWNLPLSISFKATNPFGWPQLVVSTYGLDAFGNEVVRGYGICHVPIAPGPCEKEIPMFVPDSSSILQKFTSWLTGRRPEFIDPRILSQGDMREEMAPDIVADQSGKTESYRPKQIYQHYTIPRNPKRESERLRTFINWTVSFLDPKNLAKAGFYYTNVDDVIKCAFCDVEIGCWEEGDNPEQDHQRLSPNCPFLKGQDCGNQVQSENGEESEENVNEEIVSRDVCGSYGLEIRPFSAPERPGKIPFAIEPNNLWKDFEELGVSKISGPVTPFFATYISRLKTFEDWKKHEIQTPEKLAEAGFYYTSLHDNVLCFHCGGGLKNWEVDDDPWVEHARWFSRCGFVILSKGREFVNEVLSKCKAQLTPLASKEPKENADKNTEIGQVKENKLEEHSTSPSSISPNVSSTSIPEIERQSSQSSNSETKEEIELCRICYQRERGIVFLPCGHFVSCTQCAPSLSTCAVCRKPFEATVRAYLS